MKHALPLDAVPLPAGWIRHEWRDGAEAGCLLLCSKAAEILEIPLGLTGRQTLTLGLFRPLWGFAEFDVRLSTAGHWRRVRPAHFINDPGGGMQDVPLDAADCTSAALLIRPVPETSGGIGRLQAAMAPGSAVWQPGRAGAVIDNHGLLAQSRLAGAADVEATLAPFVESDFSVICWGTGAGSMRPLYPSRVAPHFGEGQTVFCNRVNRLLAENLARLFRVNLDPLRIAVDFAQQNGRQFWANDRICHMYAPDRFNGNFSSPFQLAHPGCLTRNPDGTAGSCFSLAAEPFREYKLALLREQALYGIDGVYLDFCRFPHVIGFEDAVLQPFLRTAGDPRKHPELTQQWLAHRCSFVTGFMRQLRQTLDAAGRQTGKRLTLAVQLGNDRRTLPGCRGYFDTNYVNGFDVATWAREGLIDVFAPSRGRDYGAVSLDHLAPLVAGTSCAIWGCLGQHAPQLFPDDYNWDEYFSDTPGKRFMPIADLDARRVLQAAAEAYHQGAAGVFLWEAGSSPEVPAHWNLLRRLGHREEIMAMFGPPVGFFDGRSRIPQRRVGVEDTPPVQAPAAPIV